MKVNLTEKSPIVREMEIVVDADVVEQSFAKCFKESLKHLSLPGFRRGKVPAYMGRKYITNAALANEVAEDVIPKSFVKAIEDEKLHPVSRPSYSDVKLERGKDLEFKVSFEVIPTVEIKDYEGIEVSQERYEPSEKDVDEAIERTRAGRAELAEVTDRGLEANDIAKVSFTSYEDGTPVKGGSAKDFMMELLPANYVPGFLESIYGMKPAEKREFDVEFPADFTSELAGKKIHFKFELHQIQTRVLPELNDEFAQVVSEFKTMEELRKHIKEMMDTQVQRQANQGIAEKVYVNLSEQVPTEMMPQGLVSYHAAVFHSRVAQNLQAQHQTFEAMLAAQNKTPEEWNKHVMAMGYGEARLEIIVRNLARMLNIEVSDEDMENVVAEEAMRMRQAQSYIWKKMKEAGTVDVLRYGLLRDKVTNYLVEHAKVTYTAPKTPEEIVAEAKAEAEKAEAKKEEPAAE